MSQLLPALAGGEGVDRPGGLQGRHLTEGAAIAGLLEVGGDEAAARQGRHAIARALVGQHRAADPLQGGALGGHVQPEHLDRLPAAMVHQIDAAAGDIEAVRRELGEVQRPRAIAVGRLGGARDVGGDLAEAAGAGVDGVEVADGDGGAGHARADDPAPARRQVHVLDIHQAADIGDLALLRAGRRRRGGRGQPQAQQQGAKPDQTLHAVSPLVRPRESGDRPIPTPRTPRTPR